MDKKVDAQKFDTWWDRQGLNGADVHDGACMIYLHIQKAMPVSKAMPSDIFGGTVFIYYKRLVVNP